MRVTRFYTEDRNLYSRALFDYLDSVLQGYTTYSCTGRWNGEREQSIVIEVIEDTFSIEASSIAKGIKKVNKQKAVLFTQQEVIANLV